MTSSAPRRAVRPAPRSVRAGILVSAPLLAASLLAPGPAAAAGQPPGPGSLVCRNGVCWLDPAGLDSDGDGFSDADERAAGTDPKDPASHPQILQLIDGYLSGLRADAPGFREVVVLPQSAPDGRSLDSGALGFGPQRGDALTRLGLTDGRLDGVDVSNGVRATLTLAGPASAAHRPPVTVGRIDPLVAGGEITSESTRLGGATLTEFTQNGKDVGYKIERADGSMSIDLKADGKRQYGSLSAPEKQPDGGTKQVGSSTSILTADDGSTTSITVSSTETIDADGTKTTEKSYYSERTDDKGNRTGQTLTQVKTVEKTDGTKTTEKIVTRADSKGDTTVTTSTTTTTSDGTTTCKGNGCPKTEYVNHEIDFGPMPGDTLVVSPAMAARLAALLEGRTRSGDTGVEPGSPEDAEPPQYSPRNKGVILVDSSNDAVWWTPQPTMPDPDKVGGNVTPVRNVTTPLDVCVPTQALPCH